MSLKSLQTTTQEPIILKTVGLPNVNSGPDFFNAQLSIGTIIKPYITNEI